MWKMFETKEKVKPRLSPVLWELNRYKDGLKIRTIKNPDYKLPEFSIDDTYNMFMLLEYDLTKFIYNTHGTLDKTTDYVLYVPSRLFDDLELDLYNRDIKFSLHYLPDSFVKVYRREDLNNIENEFKGIYKLIFTNDHPFKLSKEDLVYEYQRYNEMGKGFDEHEPLTYSEWLFSRKRLNIPDYETKILEILNK